MRKVVSREQEEKALEAFFECGERIIRSCLCGETSGLILAEEERFNLPIETRMCDSCKTIRSSSSPLDNKRFYKEFYSVLHPGLGTEKERAAREKRQAEYLLAEGYIEKGKKVIEIGGNCCRYLETVSYSSIDISGREENSNILVAGNDYVISLHVLEHIHNPIEFLERYKKLLSRNGKMIAVVPDINQIQYHRYVKTHGFKAWFHWAHCWNWSAFNVSLPFEKAGMRVDRISLAAPGTLATVGSLIVEASK